MERTVSVLKERLLYVILEHKLATDMFSVHRPCGWIQCSFELRDLTSSSVYHVT